MKLQSSLPNLRMIRVEPRKRVLAELGCELHELVRLSIPCASERTNRNTVPELYSASVYDPWFARGGQAFTQEDWNRSPFIVLVSRVSDLIRRFSGTAVSGGVRLEAHPEGVRDILEKLLTLRAVTIVSRTGRGGPPKGRVSPDSSTSRPNPSIP